MPRSRRTTTEPNEAAVAAALEAFLAAEKSVSSPIHWRLDGRSLRFAVTLDIEGVTEAGMLLFGRASISLPERNVTLGLSRNEPMGRGGNFDRLDWRHVYAHANRGLGPRRHRFAVIARSHHHPFAENAALPMGLLRAIGEGLPFALPIDPEPPDWPAFLGVAERRWRLHGLVPAPLPPLQYDLGLPAGKRPIAGKGRKA